jgi:hypothetical protein
MWLTRQIRRVNSSGFIIGREAVEIERRRPYADVAIKHKRLGKHGVLADSPDLVSGSVPLTLWPLSHRFETCP